MSIQQVPSLWPAVITIITFLGVAWLAVTLRVFTRVIIIRSFGFDDYTMLVTLVSAYDTLTSILLRDYPKRHYTPCTVVQL
jgi:hypothetical protein